MTDKHHNDDGQPDPAIFATIHHQSEHRPDGYTSEDIAALNSLANGAALRTQKRKNIWAMGGASALAVAALIGGAAWLSPTWTPGQILNAAKAGDRSKLEELVDFGTVRSSLEADLKDMMGAAFRKEVASTGDPLVMLFGGLGAGIVDATATSMAEQIVTPIALEKAVNGEDVHFDLLGEAQNIRPDLRLDNNGRSNFTSKGRYLTASRYEYQIRSKSSDANIYVQMKRTGPFSWQVDRVKLDPDWFTPEADAKPKAPLDRTTASPAETKAALSPSTVDVRDEEIWSLYEHDDCGDLVGPERTGCWEAEHEIQDRRLNMEYAALQSRLDSAGKERLRQIQLAWIRARDAECADPDQGGSGSWVETSCLTFETAKRRVILKNYQP